MINTIFNHAADFANCGGDAQRNAIFRAGFYTLSVADEHTPDGKCRISASVQGKLENMPEALQAELKKNGETWSSDDGSVFYACERNVDGVKIRITGVEQ
jgi:hypothetical protein